MSVPPPRRRAQSFSEIKPVVLQRSTSVPPLSPTDTMVMAPPPGFSIAGLAAAIGPSAPPVLPPLQPALPPPPESEPAPTLVLVRRSPSAPSPLEIEVVGTRGANARTLIGLPAAGAANEPGPVPAIDPEPESAPAHAAAPAAAPAPAVARPRLRSRVAVPAYRPWPRWLPLAVFGVFVALSLAELLVAYAMRP